METKKEEVKKVWVKPELKMEELQATEVKTLTYRREVGGYRT